MDYEGREVEECHLVQKAIDPDGIKGYGHVEENWTGEPLFAKIPGYSFNESGRLQRRAIIWSEPKVLVSQKSAFVYYM